MITNFNDTRETSTELFDIKKFIGVGTIKIMAVNPNNATLRKYGWTIPDGADEPSYVSVDKDGKKSARVRFLAQIQELDDKPILAMDFWIRPEFRTSTSSGELKVQVIDNYGRTAYVTKPQYDKHEVPQYSNGPAKIDNKYRMAHSGEADLIQFLMTFLNVTPFEMFDRLSKSYVPTKSPGELTIDHWDRLCGGNATEIKEYLNLKPQNQMKVCFGIRTNQDNKSYQAFLTSAFFPNDIFLDQATNKYKRVQKEIDRYMQVRGSNSNITLLFDASPVREYSVSASDVKDNSDSDMPSFDSPEFFTAKDDDLPFGDE